MEDSWHRMRWADCAPTDTTPVDQVKNWPDMPGHAVDAFKQWTGLRFPTGTRLVRNGGEHIFAIVPGNPKAVCVYRHSRTFGEVRK